MRLIVKCKVYNSAHVTLDSLGFKQWLLSHLMEDVKQK